MIRFPGVPTFFLACCHRAREGKEGAYRTAGQELARRLDVYLRCESDEEQEAKFSELQTLLDGDDFDGVWRWFKREFPSCMKFVPTRRKDRFLDGVFGAYAADLIEPLVACRSCVS